MIILGGWGGICTSYISLSKLVFPKSHFWSKHLMTFWILIFENYVFNIKPSLCCLLLFVCFVNLVRLSMAILEFIGLHLILRFKVFLWAFFKFINKIFYVLIRKDTFCSWSIVLFYWTILIKNVGQKCTAIWLLRKLALEPRSSVFGFRIYPQEISSPHLWFH